ncbi:MAG: NAD kinase, partial [Betaproteobacteria bacterium]
MSASFRTIGLIGKYNSPDIVDPLLRLAGFLEGRGVQVLLDRLTAGHVGQTRYTVLPLEDVGKQADLAVVIG